MQHKRGAWPAFLLVTAIMFASPAAAHAQRARDGSYWDRANSYQAVQMPNRKMDTSGTGDFYSGVAGSERVRRAYFDSRNPGRIELGYSGERDFRIRFYGQVVEQYSDRRFTIRLTDSDRGPATGTAEVKLNSDKNEIEAMMLSGAVRGSRFAGDFRRGD